MLADPHSESCDADLEGAWENERTALLNPLRATSFIV